MKEQVQRVGRFLSGMVMPNIGAFIAWGLITALFIPDGWIPNKSFATIVGPMLTYLLPILIGYTGGSMVAGQRGAVVGAIATTGVIIGADIPMFLGAMIAGPLGGLCIRWFDRQVDGRIPAGFEMLINNFSSGIIGGALALIAFLAINPLCVALTAFLSSGVDFFVRYGLLPLTAIFVEPAKVLFLNNAINHGIFTPLGIEQAASAGKSIFFMIESNPGPGLGLLLAYSIAGKGNARTSAPGAIIIHFFGGIHEIYFPYILMNPILILATIAGSMCSIFTLQVLGGGLVAAASPGSIFAEMIMTPKGGFFANISAITISTLVSFAVAVVLLRFTGKDRDLEEAQEKMQQMKSASKGLETGSTAPAAGCSAPVSKIVFACDAGMGSSAMGATMLRKKLANAGIGGIEVIHSPVSEIPPDTDIIIVHRELLDRAVSTRPGTRAIPIGNFMNAPEYDVLVEELKK